MKQSESIQVLFGRFFTYLGLSAVFILLGLSIGIIGYHWTVGLSWRKDREAVTNCKVA